MTERELYNTLVDGINRRFKAKQEAAAELDRLRAENTELRLALGAMVENAGYGNMTDDELRAEHEAGNQFARVLLAARAALKEPEKE